MLTVPSGILHRLQLFILMMVHNRRASSIDAVVYNTAMKQIPPRPKRILAACDDEEETSFVQYPFVVFDSKVDFFSTKISKPRNPVIPKRVTCTTTAGDISHTAATTAISVPLHYTKNHPTCSYPISIEHPEVRPVTPIIEQDDDLQPPSLIRMAESCKPDVAPYNIDEDCVLHGLGFLNEDFELSDDEEDEPYN